MKKSEYDSLIKYAKSPYLGWIDTKESIGEADEKREYNRILNKGYGVFVSTGDGMLRCINREEISSLTSIPDLCRVDGEFYKFVADVIDECAPDVLYCDEDVEDEKGVRTNPFLKPDFSPDTLESFFYLGEVIVLNKEKFKEDLISKKDVSTLILEDMREKLDQGCRYVGVYHIPRIYVHVQPQIKPISAQEWSIGDGVLIDDFANAGCKVSCVILSKDNPKMLFECIRSLKKYSNISMEYVVVDNGSSLNNRGVISKQLNEWGVIYSYSPQEFVYSALCNKGASLATGNYLLFMNDDVILPESTRDFPLNMLRKASQKHVGAVGVRLLYPSGLIQHVGMHQLKSGPSHRLASYPDDVLYERGRNRGMWNVMGVTGACMMVKRERFDEVGGFDEAISIAYTDTDLCLDLWDKGYYNVVLCNTALIHHESVSRGSDARMREKLDRLNRERELLYKKHPYLTTDKGDPFGNINLSRNKLSFDVDYYQPWENESLLEKIEEVNECLQRTEKPGKLLGSVDRIDVHRAIAADDCDYIEIEGWCILHRKDMLKVDPAVVLVIDGKEQVIKCSRKYRPELLEIFPNEKNQLLSGFITRVVLPYRGIDIDSVDLDKLNIIYACISTDLIGRVICHKL